MATKKWRETYPEEAKAGNRRYALNHPDTMLTTTHRHNARKRENGGSFTAVEWEQVKADQGYICPGCLLFEPDIVLTVDHIIPVSKGGTNDISNIQGLCGPCNSRKGNRRWTL